MSGFCFDSQNWKDIKMQIILASNNSEKLIEFNQLFVATDFTIIPQSQFNVSEVAETGLTFVENAIIKARNACLHAGLPVIADDSGLVVDALNGAPGVRSARYAHEKATYQENCVALLSALHNVPEEKRIAKFYCVLVYLRHSYDPSPVICHGCWEGSILFESSGQNGFGYDSIFFVPTHNCSAAELPLEIKNKISHRGQALRKLLRVLHTLNN